MGMPIKVPCSLMCSGHESEMGVAWMARGADRVRYWHLCRGQWELHRSRASESVFKNPSLQHLWQLKDHYTIDYILPRVKPAIRCFQVSPRRRLFQFVEVVPSKLRFKLFGSSIFLHLMLLLHVLEHKLAKISNFFLQ